MFELRRLGCVFCGFCWQPTLQARFVTLAWLGLLAPSFPLFESICKRTSATPMQALVCCLIPFRSDETDVSANTFPDDSVARDVVACQSLTSLSADSQTSALWTRCSPGTSSPSSRPTTHTLTLPSTPLRSFSLLFFLFKVSAQTSRPCDQACCEDAGRAPGTDSPCSRRPYFCSHLSGCG